MGNSGQARHARRGRIERHRPARTELVMNFNERMIDPKSPDRRPRRAAYALPTFFTAGNIFLGYLSVIQSFQGAMLASGTGVGAEPHFEMAAKCIGLAVFLDGLDGRIARMTNTTSDFGREMDSLADAISFGIAPAVLAFAWGIQFLDPTFDAAIREHVVQVGYFISFLFLLCGSAASGGAACIRLLLPTRSTRLADRIPKTGTVALVGSESLIGREIRDVFETSHFPARLSLIASGADETGVLTEQEGEPTVVVPLDALALGAADAVFLAGSADSTRTALELGIATPLIDLTYAGEESPRARLRAPMVEPAGHSVPPDTVHVIASPASIVLTLVLNRLHPLHPIARVVAH